MVNMPVLTVIAGPNGSGKTTLTTYLVPKQRVKSVVINPDEIAKQELGSYDCTVQAARIALKRRTDGITALSDIAFETTFSGHTEIAEIKRARTAGYTNVLYYIALNTILDNINRVNERYTQYGHTVYATDVARRFEKSKANLIYHISLFDIAYLFDNSGSKRSRVAIFEHGKLMWLNAKHQNHLFYKKLFNL
jgi:predicted ABC-type ATPase